MSGIRSLFLSALVVATSLLTYAVPAKPGLSVRTLPDGTQISVKLVGDEHSHYWLSEDNYLIIPDKSGSFAYATLDADGNFVRSAVDVSPLSARKPIEKNFLATLDRDAVMSALEQQQTRAIARKPHSPARAKSTYPTAGEQRAIVVLVDYQDIKFTVDDAHAKFDNMLNLQGYSDNDGTGSARDWFVENSCSQFTPAFDVYGPITLSHNRSYYGSNDNNGDDELAYEMVVEACRQLDDTVDFTQYDRDGDGFIDNVYIFYAGYGENLGGDAPADCVWPHSDDITNITSQMFFFDGVRLDHYACSNELTLEKKMEGIGTFCHEFSHVLGLPDLYATNYSYAFTPGDWSVLDNGPYNNDGHTPPYYTAYERYELGWLTPKAIGAAARHSLDNISTNQAYIIKTAKDSEYFLLENRQQTGWDKYIPGHGMLIWHIDYNEAVWNTNTVNNKRSHQYADIEEADGIESDGTVDGDPFPGSYNITSFTDDTTPSMCSWDGSRQDKPITNISESNGIITFTISGGKAELDPVVALDPDSFGQYSFTAAWEANPDATEYLLSVYYDATLPNGKVASAYLDGYERLNVGNVTSFTVEGLQPRHVYKYSVKCYDSNSGRESIASNEVQVITADPYLEEEAPVAAPATDISADGFTANWMGHGFGDYFVLNVYQKQYGDPETESIDFEGGISGLPAGWSTSSNLTYSQNSYSGSSAPSLRLAPTDNYIASPTFADGIRALEFWHRGANAADDAALKIMAYVDGVWQEAVSLSVVNTSGGATTRIEGSELPNGATAVAINYQTEGRGSVAIDDIVVEHGGLLATTPVEGYDGLNVGITTSYRVSVPTVGATYYYTVKEFTSNYPKTPLSNEIAVAGATSGIRNVAADGLATAKVVGNHIVITSPKAANVALYSISGNELLRTRAAVGVTEIEAPSAGIYLLSVENQLFKLSIKH